MTIISKIRKTVYQKEIDRRDRFYNVERMPGEIAQWQLAQFNKNWANIQEAVPYYQKRVALKQIPSAFESWEQFQMEMPILTRGVIQLHYEEMIDRRKPTWYYSVTSGTISEPMKFPHWKSERIIRSDMWLGRKWHHISPADSCLFVWGTRHRLNPEDRFSISRIERELKDILLGYTRFSAYHLSDERLQEAGKIILRKNPDYIVGYSSALYSLALANKDYQTDFHKTKLKAIIATSESFSFEDSPQIISEVFGAPVVMEYGSEELGVVAYTDAESKYRVFWKSVMMEAIKSDVADQKRLLVTSLYPRQFPLIRYDQGDSVGLLPGQKNTCNLTEFHKLNGRIINHLVLKDGSTIIPVVFSDVLKLEGGVVAFQIVEIGDRLELHIILERGASLQEKMKQEIHTMLSLVHLDLAAMEIKQVTALHQTPRGKTPQIIKLMKSDNSGEIYH